MEEELALDLAKSNIRITAPIPGRGTIGIEVPHGQRSVVRLRSLLASDTFQQSNQTLPIAIGHMADNQDYIVDLETLPNLLIAGATGQGKSIAIHAIVTSLLYKKHPSQLKLVLMDPQKIELGLYRGIEKHFLAKVPGGEEPVVSGATNAAAATKAAFAEGCGPLNHARRSCLNSNGSLIFFPGISGRMKY